MPIDGLLTLIGACVVLIASGGLTYCYCLYRVIHTAKSADSDISPGQVAVVFGQKLMPDETPDSDYQRRLTRAHKLKPNHIWVLGGHTAVGSDKSEAAAGRDWLCTNGMSSENISIEERSRHTLENLSMLRDRASTETGFALVSNRYHLERIRSIAQGLGLKYTLCAAETAPPKGFEDAHKIASEAFFLHWYLTGSIVAHALHHKGMLRRIS
tara:strand:+ start:12065 stop:12700 length:636 start_codon:yes stop_codon:yes gene_type:complete